MRERDDDIAKAKRILEKKKAKRILAERAVLLPQVPFPPQEAFVNDKSRYIVAQCSRRSGKTNGLALRFFQTMQRHPKSTCLYLAMTLDSAMDIMWGVLKEQNDAYGLHCRFIDSKHEVIHPNGSKLKLYGADMSNFVKRLKGQKSPGIAVDEAQDFGPHLESLIVDVLNPMMADYSDPWLALTGTPGAVPSGFFYEITEKKEKSFSIHKWCGNQNPYMPNYEAFIQDLQTKFGWKDDHPTLMREWRNEWVLDSQSLWIQWLKESSDYINLPPGNYSYICGVDIGFRDADAISILGYADNSTDVYLIEEIITTKQTITDLVNQLHAINAKYNFPRIVMDEGGLGTKMAEEMRIRHGLNIEAAEKSRKQENATFLNDALRTGKFRAKEQSRFTKDSMKVEVDWSKSRPDKIVLRSGFHSDIIDSVLYAFKLSPAYAFMKEPPKFIIGSREWYAAQNENLFEQALEHYQNQENEKGGGWSKV